MIDPYSLRTTIWTTKWARPKSCEWRYGTSKFRDPLL